MTDLLTNYTKYTIFAFSMPLEIVVDTINEQKNFNGLLLLPPPDRCWV